GLTQMGQRRRRGRRLSFGRSFGVGCGSWLGGRIGGSRGLFGGKGQGGLRFSVTGWGGKSPPPGQRELRRWFAAPPRFAPPRPGRRRPAGRFGCPSQIRR